MGLNKTNETKKENLENITETALEQGFVDDKFLKEIPTKDKEILKKLDEIDKKLEAFEIDEDEEEDDKDNKKNLGLVVGFVALLMVAVGFFVFEKRLKNGKN